MYGESLGRLITELTRLPGIGRKTAERLAFHLLKSQREAALRLADAIRDIKDKVRPCSICFHVADTDPCSICEDPRRDRESICVVEQPKDLLALESTGSYNGLYHVLMGSVALLDGVEPGDLTTDHLVARVEEGGVKEVIIATNPNLDGDATALHIARALASADIRITRLARGVPTGSTIEYASKAILMDALEGRREV